MVKNLRLTEDRMIQFDQEMNGQMVVWTQTTKGWIAESNNNSRELSHSPHVPMDEYLIKIGKELTIKTFSFDLTIPFTIQAASEQEASELVNAFRAKVMGADDIMISKDGDAHSITVTNGTQTTDYVATLELNAVTIDAVTVVTSTKIPASTEKIAEFKSEDEKEVVTLKAEDGKFTVEHTANEQDMKAIDNIIDRLGMNGDDEDHTAAHPANPTHIRLGAGPRSINL